MYMFNKKGEKRGMRAFVQVIVAALLVASWPGLLSIGPSGAYGAESGDIISFEMVNPVYTAWVELGTSRDALDLPETLRAVCELPKPEKADEAAAKAAANGELIAASETFVSVTVAVNAQGEGETVKVDKSAQEGFVQTAPVPDEDENFDYYWYGYVAPRGEEELRAADELVIYTIYYADETRAYRVHGTYNGADEGFYACDKQGTIFGVVLDVPVTWKGSYKASQEGTYSFTAQMKGFKFDGEVPFAEVTVLDEDLSPHEHDGDCDHEDENILGDEAQAQEQPNAPEQESTLGPLAVECTCENGLHDAANAECPEYNSEATFALDEGIEVEYAQSLGEENLIAPMEAELGEGISIMPMGIGINGGGTNDIAQDDWMLTRAPTVGNGDYYNSQYSNNVRLPASWINYVNTIWHNKGVNKFDWTDPADTGAHMYNGVRWAWKGTVGNGNNGAANKNNNNTTITPTTDPLCIPTYTGTNPRVYTVYSGEQLRWVLSETTNTSTTAMTVQLGANIDLNGNNFNWGLVQRTIAGTVTLTSTPGNHFTIYNMGILQTTFGNAAGTPAAGGDSVGLYNSGRNSTDSGVDDATRNFQRFSMETCKVVAGQSLGYVGSDGVMRIAGSSVLGQHSAQRGTVSDVHVLKSLVFGVRQDYPNQQGPINGSQGSGSTLGTQLFMTGISNDSTVSNSSTISNCSVEGGFVYGREHVVSFMRGIRNGTVSNCYAVDNLICGTAQHSAAFMSCGTRGTSATVTNCFSSAEMYGGLQVSGFIAFYDPNNITDCYSTGKLEGYQYLGGFYTAANSGNGVAIERCYSTTLVGLRTNPACQGGFYADMYNGQAAGATAQTRTGHMLRNVYAAGEVGNYDVNLNAPASVGGFASMKHDLSRIVSNTANGSDALSVRIQYCYYDKQTTAMREWTVGTDKNYMAQSFTDTNVSSAYNGVRGVLTSSTIKAGTGLASGSYGTISDLGFRGFSNNTLWSYQPQHYPQLRSHAAPTTGDGWLAKELATVEAWSKASTATVFLDTWKEGYEWDSNGVRTPEKTTWNSRPGGTNHEGGIYTYDTVRDIITDFPVTKIAANDTAWTKQIPGGAPSWVSGWHGGFQTTDHIFINDDIGHVSIEHPGLDWYDVSEFVAGKKGHRPLRLISYMSVDAGEDQTIMSGDTYNHRLDVELAMMDNLKDNMVVGIDDAEIWSESLDMGYPSESPMLTPTYPLVANPSAHTTDYYFAPTDVTHFTASQGAWVNTDIWRAKKDPTGEFYVDKDGNALTEDYDPIYGDIQLVPQYLIGVVGPATNNDTTLDEQMWNGEKPLYSGMASENKYIVTYYWVLADGRYRVDEKVITIKPGEYDLNVNVFNSRTNAPTDTVLEPMAAPDDEDVRGYTYTGTTAQHAEALENTQATNMAGAWKKANEGVKVKKIELIMRELDGSVAGTAEISGANLVEGAEIEIPLDYYFFEELPDTNSGIIHTVMHHASATVTYIVKKDDQGGYYLHFNKMINPPTGEAGYVQLHKDDSNIETDKETYVNDIGHHITINLYVDEINEILIEKNLTEPAKTDETFVFKVEYCGNDEEPGAVERTMYAVVTIEAGETYGYATFVDMPYGFYTVTELESNWTYTLVAERLESDHVSEALIDEQNQSVTLWAEDSSALYTYWNTREDTPWVFAKNTITNYMPSIDEY